VSAVLLFNHSHEPVFRVVRAGWRDPLDASFSQMRPDNRWNTAEFPALYCCCSEAVARAVVLDVFHFAGVEMGDLKAGARPQLIEIGWRGEAVDMISPEGIAAAGFPHSYPRGVSKDATRVAAARWNSDGRSAIVCRSASLSRQGLDVWEGAHERWGELAIFGLKVLELSWVLKRRRSLSWLR